MHRTSLVLLLLAAPAAHAADTVIYAGDAAGVAERVAQATGKPASDLQLVTLTDLLQDAKSSLTAGKLETCAGDPTTNMDVSALLSSAESFVGDLDFDPAGEALTAADAALLCLTEPMDVSKVARIEYLRGVVFHFSGKGDAARAAFRQALALQPGMEWDMNFPPSARTEFDNAAKEITTSPKVTLALVPRSVPVTLDGKTATLTGGKVDVAAGPHLLQLGSGSDVTTVRVDMASPASLLVPSAVPADAVAWAADPDLAGDLGRVLAEPLKPGQTVYVATATDVYQGNAGATSWTRVTPAPTTGPPPTGMIVAGAGGAVFLTGAIVAVSGYSAGVDAINDAEAAPRYSGWLAQQEDYRKARARLTTGKVISLVGLAAGGAGAVMMLNDDMGVAPMFLADGGGVTLTFGEVR